ncbi:hypothetical protein J3459_017919 [Metarhizium acridum]|uniref:uncharacterized protein n=1 Tax=Metarhizium acridum TaxID=92637 RepID=UPI001C6BB567|nr:hypothetical protein J3459_017919 [Metarhizium acridum]KAG8411103.1 hypothetical protein J3458_016213 [Metarhizium acridum]
MYFLTLFIAMLMANIVKSSAIHARQKEPILECADEAPSPDFLQLSKLLQSSNSSLTRRQTGDKFNFDVFAHVVYYDKTARGGYVEEEDIKNAIEAMNWNFDGSGISFTLINVSYTENRDWATLQDVTAMKNELREGTYADLNLYYVSTIEEDKDRGTTTSGTCTLPVTFHVNGNPVDITTRKNVIVSERNLVRDGCIIVARSVNRDTATHEVGHWLGLLHTFAGSCSDDGDMIDDTSPQEQPTWRCSAVRGRLPDGTPAHYACGDWRETNMYNFMDYS